MTIPSFDGRKIKWTELTSALGKSKFHQKRSVDQWNDKVFMVDNKVQMTYELAGTIKYRPTSTTTFWAD